MQRSYRVGAGSLWSAAFDAALFVRSNRDDSAIAQLADRITVDSDRCDGNPCIRGLRIRVSDVDLLAAGLTAEQVIEELPDLELDDIAAALRCASRRLDSPDRPR